MAECGYGPESRQGPGVVGGAVEVPLACRDNGVVAAAIEVGVRRIRWALA